MKRHNPNNDGERGNKKLCDYFVIPVIRQRSKSKCAALTSSSNRNDSDGKVSLNRQRTLETTRDTEDVSKFY